MTAVENRPSLPFHREMQFEYGVLQELQPGLRRLVCHNPSAFTFKGTNTYVLGQGRVAVIDPGPDKPDHVNTLLKCLQEERITDVLLTHCHGDHSGAVSDLVSKTGAKTYGMARREDDPAINKISPSGSSFVKPVAFDVCLRHQDQFEVAGFSIEALHTPGHAPDHLCFSLRDLNILISGDHVMGWNTSVIAPPEGHMGRYLQSLELLLSRTETRYYPGHGGPIDDPRRLVKAFILHRRWREGDIYDCLRQGFNTIGQLVPKIYGGIDSSLIAAASLAVLAQLELMVEKGLVKTLKPGPISLSQEFALRMEAKQAT